MVHYSRYTCNLKSGNESIEEKLSDLKVSNEVTVKYCVTRSTFPENPEKNMNVLMLVKTIHSNIVLRMQQFQNANI